MIAFFFPLLFFYFELVEFFEGKYLILVKLFLLVLFCLRLLNTLYVSLSLWNDIRLSVKLVFFLYSSFCFSCAIIGVILIISVYLLSCNLQWSRVRFICIPYFSYLSSFFITISDGSNHRHIYIYFFFDRIYDEIYLVFSD